MKADMVELYLPLALTKCICEMFPLGFLAYGMLLRYFKMGKSTAFLIPHEKIIISLTKVTHWT